LKLYEITLKPQSGFGTSLKGDTLFGHFCWQAAYDHGLLNGGLDKWIACYSERPFAVFSSAWPKFKDKDKTRYAVKRPDLPLSFFFPEIEGNCSEAMKERKKRAGEKWMLIDEDLSLRLDQGDCRSDDDLLKMAGGQLTEETGRMMQKQAAARFQADLSQPHNTINRLTQTTGKGAFAPFSETSWFYYPEMELALFALLEEEATDIDRVTDALTAIGLFGFGRDASTGGGRFSLAEGEEKTIPTADGANACYLLAPAIPEKSDSSEHYFTPFVRFGKHGDRLARSANPFRNPVIMADEGAVFIPKNRAVFEKPYLGRPAFNTSKVMAQTVVQGYAPYLPFRLER